MKIDKGMLGMLAGVSLFIGFVFGSALIGTLIPPAHKLTAPLICSGKVDVETRHYSYKPGQTGYQVDVYCTDERGVQSDISLPSFLLLGLIVSVIAFVIIIFRSHNLLRRPEDYGISTAGGSKKTGSRLERLVELKKMYDSGLITKAEYEGKKARIMDEV